MTSVQPLVSIVVTNYNYELYVGRAVESALSQTYPRLEVVVVDDGSTDGSLSTLNAFSDRVTVLRQHNQGMAASMNNGFDQSRGELVLFLDADDFLHPDCVVGVVQAATPGCSKVHWRLRLVDADEARMGSNPAPAWRLADGDVSAELCRTGGYSTVPTSGNCYARTALEQVMPIPEEDFHKSGDSYLNLAVVFVGPVVAIERELSSYRLHGNNHSASAFDTTWYEVRLSMARAMDEWLPVLAARFGRGAKPGAVLGQPEFRFMSLLARSEAVPRERRAGRVLQGFATGLAAVRTRSIRPRRRVLLAMASPLLPLLPTRAVHHVRDVAYAGKALRAWRRLP